MNGTVISEKKLRKLKKLSKEISELELEILCFGEKEDLIFKLRKKTEKLTNKIIEL